MAIYNYKMDISVTEFKHRCLEIIRSVEQSGKRVTITRRGRPVAQLQAPPPGASARNLKPWQRLRMLEVKLTARPGEFVVREEDFEALR